MCNQAGRDGMSGSLRVEAIIATLAALDGADEDLDKVLAIEAIAQELRPEKE